MSQENQMAFGNSAGLTISLAALNYLTELVGGEEHLELFKDAAPADKLSDVLDGSVTVIAEILEKQGPDATVGEFVEKLEAAVALTPTDNAGDAAAETPAADQSAPAGGVQEEPVAEPAKEVNLGANGTEIADTSSQPGKVEEAPAAPAVVEPSAPVENLQAAKAEVVLVVGQPDWFAGLTPMGKVLKSQFDQYIVDMAPKKPVDAEQAARHQVILFRTLTNTINNTTDDFQTLWSYYLSKFEEHATGVFDELRVLRAMDVINLGPNEIRTYQRLINLLKLTATPATRKAALKQVDIGLTLKFGFTDAGRQRVINFYEF